MGMNDWKNIQRPDSVERVHRQDQEALKESRQGDQKKDLAAALKDLKEPNPKEAREARPRGVDGKPQVQFKGEKPQKLPAADTRAGAGRTDQPSKTEVRPTTITASTLSQTPKNVSANPQTSHYAPTPQTPQLMQEVMGKLPPPLPKQTTPQQTIKEQAGIPQQERVKLTQAGPSQIVTPPPQGEGATLAQTKLRDEKHSGLREKEEEPKSKKTREGSQAKGAGGSRNVEGARQEALGAASSGVASDQGDQAPQEVISYAINPEGPMDRNRETVRLRRDEYYYKLEQSKKIDPLVVENLLAKAKALDEEVSMVLRAYGLYGGIVG